MILVEIANEQETHPIDIELLERGVKTVLAGESIDTAKISLAIVDDPTIHVLNRKYLEHDYETDVLSFLLSDEAEPIDGEVIVSVDTAAREADQFGWTTIDELLLYVIHGTLHLVGYDDKSDELRSVMRGKERMYLGELGRCPCYDDSGKRSVHPSASTSLPDREAQS